LPFRHAEYNFYRAAQHGLDAILLWPTTRGNSPREAPVRELCHEYLSVAAAGLGALGVAAGDIDTMLGVIRDRLDRDLSPARWQRHLLDRLDANMPRPDALRRLLEIYMAEAATRRPMSQWNPGA
jgi:hypothetical protein